MLFNTLEFALFFISVLAVYYLLPLKWQNAFLLLASYFFYGYWDWLFLILIWISTLTAHFVAIEIENTDDATRRRRILFIAVSINLGLLGIFKYYNFFSDNFFSILNSLGFKVDPFYLRLALPVGISFYTFQAIGYVVDVYRKQTDAETKLSNTALSSPSFLSL